MTPQDIAANVAASSLEGFVGTMTASLQRKVFGRAIFGRKTLCVDHTNQTVFGSFKVCFGTDSQTFRFSYDELAALANNPEKQVSW